MSIENFTKVQELTKTQADILAKLDATTKDLNSIIESSAELAPEFTKAAKELRTEGWSLLRDLFILESRRTVLHACNNVTFDEVLEAGRELQRQEAEDKKND